MPAPAASPAPGSFGALLRQLRRDAGLTQDALAEQAGLSARGIQDLERGVGRPQRQTAERLADALALSGEERVRFDAAAQPAPRRPRFRYGPAGATLGPDAPAVQGTGHRLPAPLSSFVGRRAEVAAVVRLLDDPSGPRLVTITGPGGTGKTRLALRAAEQLGGRFSGGSCFVPLDAVQDPALVPAVVAHALGLPADGTAPTTERLREYLRPRETLLVLDNLEHLLEVAPFVAALLAGSPGLRVLATSRGALRVSGEQELPLGPLPVPGEAVQLFVERARAARPDVCLTPDAQGVVSEICSRLDGLPLAIELAAARIRLLPPSAMLGQLRQHRLALLAGGSRDAPERQRTMRAAIAWSYDLLSEATRRLFRHLGVFSGGCDLDAVPAVCADEDTGVVGGVATVPGSLLDGLEALVAGGLLRQGQEPAASGSARFTMLATLREFALERLGEAGEAPALYRRHARWCLALAEQAAPHLRSAAQDGWFVRLDEERDNLRAALTWCQDHADTDPEAAPWGLRLASALFRYWVWTGMWAEAARPLGFFLAHPRTRFPAHAGTRVVALTYAAVVCSVNGDEAAADACRDEAVALARTLEDPARLALALTVPATGETEPARLEEAAGLLEEGVRLAGEFGHLEALGFGCMGLGNVALRSGDAAAARTWYARALDARRQQGDKWGIAQALLSLAEAVSRQGDHSEARRLLGEAIRLFPRVPALRAGSNIAMGLAELGAVAVAAGDAARAATILGAVDVLARGQGFQLPPPHRLGYGAAVDAARARLGGGAFRTAWDAGQAMTLDQAIDFALDDPE